MCVCVSVSVRVSVCVLEIACNLGVYGGNSGYKVLTVRSDDSSGWWLVPEILVLYSVAAESWTYRQADSFSLEVNRRSKS